MPRRYFTIIAVGLLLLLSSVRASEDASIDAPTALRLAEEFIRANGYTDAPATKPVTELDAATFERLPREEWLRMRHGTMEARACAYKRGADRLSDQDGWTVLFRFKEAASSEAIKLNDQFVAAGVEMDRHGQHILVRHGGIPSVVGTSEFRGFTSRQAHAP